jgi:penicillin amidase
MWLAALAGCALGPLATKARSYPELGGEHVVAGLARPTWLARDALGVPHVRAHTDDDAWFALGFAHGQDRLFQADVTRRAAYGRLAEWLGEDAADVDLFARTLGLADLAAAELARLDPETRAMLEAYARGVNAAAADGRALPVEHRLLRATFEPWRPEDCLAIGYLMSWTLGENLRAELAAWALRDLPTGVLDAALAADAGVPGIDPYWDTLKSAQTGPLTPAFRAWSATFGGAPTSAASNNWVIGPERSADGLPIVANDPHLTQAVPSLWYAADVSGATFHAAGATLPGLPGFPVGHSAHVAWGLTNVMADTTDVVVLERRGDGYVLGGEVLPFEAVDVTISVKGEPRTERVLRTRVGPVISDPAAEHVLALRWASLELEDVLPVTLRTLAQATSADEVLAAAKAAPMVVALNLVVADDRGGWGWQTAGGMVKRRAHTGRVPYPGGDPAHGWDGLLTDTPGSGPVAEGFLVTANQRPDAPGADAISTAWIPPHRADRLRALLAEVPRHTPDHSRAIQLDRQEGDAVRWLDGWLAGVAPSTDDARTCARLLTEWDRVADVDAVGVTVWVTFQGELQDVVLARVMSEAQRAVVAEVSTSGQSPLSAGTLRALTPDPAVDADAALDRTCARLREELGPDPARWAWGDAHPLALRHPFAAASRLLRGWNLPVVPSGGTGATVAAAGTSLSARFPREVGGMASVRVVMPLSDLGASTLVYPGGQSGQPGAPFSTSHFDAFVADGVLPLWFRDAQLADVPHAAWLLPAP